MATFDDLRVALTRYKQDKSNLVLEADYEAIIEFIQFLESERATTTTPTPSSQARGKDNDI